MTPRALILQLEQSDEHQDDLHKRLIDSLKGYADASEAYVDAVERHVERASQARLAIIAGARCLQEGAKL